MTYDFIIIGGGLGGLTAGAKLAKEGKKVMLLEQHDRPGGYATTFKRPGGFEFDVSLHSTVVGERDGVHNLIPGFPEITGVEFHPHLLARLIKLLIRCRRIGRGEKHSEEQDWH